MSILRWWSFILRSVRWKCSGSLKKWGAESVFLQFVWVWGFSLIPVSTLGRIGLRHSNTLGDLARQKSCEETLEAMYIFTMNYFGGKYPLLTSQDARQVNMTRNATERRQCVTINDSGVNDAAELVSVSVSEEFDDWFCSSTSFELFLLLIYSLWAYLRTNKVYVLTCFSKPKISLLRHGLGTLVRSR